MLYISPRLLKALLYPLSLTLLYLPNLFLIVGQHDHVAHPVLEGHSPEVQHCVLFWTLNNEDFKIIQPQKSAMTAKIPVIDLCDNHFADSLEVVDV